MSCLSVTIKPNGVGTAYVSLAYKPMDVSVGARVGTAWLSQATKEASVSVEMVGRRATVGVALVCRVDVGEIYIALLDKNGTPLYSIQDNQLFAIRKRT